MRTDQSDRRCTGIGHRRIGRIGQSARDVGRSGPGQGEEAGARLSTAACGLPCLFESDVRPARKSPSPKNWQRDFNRSAMTLSGRVSKDKDVRDTVTQAEASLTKIFPERFTHEGYQVVAAPGPDVLRLGVAIVNLEVNAPERDVPGRSRSYAVDAGEATFAIEVRDLLTGQLLGRAVEKRQAGEGPTYRRNYSSNLADFEALFDDWARIAARGLTELKFVSPVDTGMVSASNSLLNPSTSPTPEPLPPLPPGRLR